MFPIHDHNPARSTPYVTWALIAINTVIFLLTWPYLLDQQTALAFFSHWALIPAKVTLTGDWSGIVTSMFLHGGLMHLLGNMLFLYIFGDNVEDALGHVGFLLFYLACGIFAALIHYWSNPLSEIPTVGASGAIAGVLGGYLMLYPRARVDVAIIFFVFFQIIQLPAWFMLGYWFLIQLLFGMASDPTTGGVAYWAHAGGFIAGVVLILPAWLMRGGPAWWRRTHGMPPYPEMVYPERFSRIPRVRRSRRRPRR